MNAVRHSTVGIWLTFFAVACSSPSNSDQQVGAGGSGNGGAGGATTTSGGSMATASGNGGSSGETHAGGATATSGGSTASGTGGASAGAGSTAGGATAAGGSTNSAGSSAGGATAGAANQGGSTAAGGTTSTAGAPTTGGDEPQLITSVNNGFWKTGTLIEASSGNADVTVNDGSPAQTFTGFGGTFNEKGWVALSALSDADRAKALKLLFDATDGAKFVYGRIPIGASDYATDRYTLDDTAGDTAMASFSIARDRMKLIPYIKAALVVNPNIQFWGSPWTPPPWMKDNNSYDRGNMKDDASILQAYALYLTKFAEEYGKEGIKISAIHPQNEPGFAQDYPSCGWSGALMAKFIGTYLGPTLKEHSLDTSIFVGTMSNSSSDGNVISGVMGNATAKALIKGYGLQWGMLDTYSSLNLDKSLAIWQTEHKCGNYPWVSGTNQSKAPNDFAYGVESWGLIRDWIKKGVNAYSAWNMVLDTVGRSIDAVRPWAQNALLTVDTGAKTLNLTPTYYVFRHVSQYVDPGAKVVGTSGGDALAFKNPDGTIVAVVYNSSGAKKMTVAIGGKKLQFDMPGQGWATVNYKAP